MARPEYIDIHVKSAINRVQGIPYLKWSLNPYGGCVHRCRFCFAVQYRVIAEQGTQQDFGTRLFIKTNLLEVLGKELNRPGLQGEHIGVGTATDPYQPVEGRYRLTRGALTLLRDHANPVSLLTNSPLVVRDLAAPGAAREGVLFGVHQERLPGAARPLRARLSRRPRPARVPREARPAHRPHPRPVRLQTRFSQTLRRAGQRARPKRPSAHAADLAGSGRPFDRLRVSGAVRNPPMVSLSNHHGELQQSNPGGDRFSS